MKLIFEETRKRNRCAAETTVNDLKMQCSFSTAKIVTIPKGLSYSDGKLQHGENTSVAVVPICPNHEIRLKNDFAGLFPNEPE